MEATVNVTCYKSKVLKNGESPLMVRICKNGKKKYKSLGICTLGLQEEPTQAQVSKLWSIAHSHKRED